jgi:NTE family protein
MILLVSDYVDLIRDMIKAAEERGVDKNFITNLLNRKTNFHGPFLKPRRFQDVLEGRFHIDEVIRKNFDFSSETIKLLLERGYNDARNEFEEYARNQLVKTVEK